MAEKFRKYLTYSSSVPTTLVLESTQTECRSEDLNICNFTRVPEVGTYVLSACRKMAYRVLRHARATACGQNLLAVYLADPTPVTETNPFGEHGVVIDVHNRKCTSHCIDEYYLTIRKGFRPNFTLL